MPDLLDPARYAFNFDPETRRPYPSPPLAFDLAVIARRVRWTRIGVSLALLPSWDAEPAADGTHAKAAA